MKNVLLIGAIFGVSACVPVTTTQTYTEKTLFYDNHNYEPFVGVVQVLAASQDSPVPYPAFRAGQGEMMVRFDLLEENYRPVMLRLTHCNADWKRSVLQDIQFLNTYNEFRISQFDYSAGTKVNYVSYQTTVPVPIIGGNYLLTAYEENQPDNPIFTRRIVVFEPVLSITANIERSSVVAQRISHHQMQFGFGYGSLPMTNPLQDFSVVILQNHNWTKALVNPQPTAVKPDTKTLEYEPFSGELNFPGVNEFRFFDLRATEFRGINVGHLQKRPEDIQAVLALDKPRTDFAYAQINNDLNGGFFLENIDPGDTQLQSEYVEVTFQLQAEEVPGQVFIASALDNWRRTPQNTLRYQSETGRYVGTILLKQGFYNYQYWVDEPTGRSSFILEGTHFQSQNDYEILVYYRDPARNFDQLLGYRRLSSRE